jgi:DNA-binding transcriptional regulator LsrR (DeoR family)
MSHAVPVKVVEAPIERKNREVLRNREYRERLERVCREYFVRDRKETDIAGDFQVNSATISRWLVEAKNTGIVSFDIDPRFAIQGHEDIRLARELRSLFNLDQPRVVEVETMDPYSYADDDYLHAALGNHSGRSFREKISPNDTIVVSGGRTVCQAMSNVGRKPRSPVTFEPCR